jgi:hypothetical protein
LAPDSRYIVVPIFHKKKSTLEDSIQNGGFKNLVQVIRAMSDQDERLLPLKGLFLAE